MVSYVPRETSWGEFYERFTGALGFKPHSDEGKVMGLAAYGDPQGQVFPFTHLSNGNGLPHYDRGGFLKTLSEMALSLKRDYPDATAASVLLEPEIEYDHLIQVMDAIRSAEPPKPVEPAEPTGIRTVGDAPPLRVALFTDIAVGDAPGRRPAASAACPGAAARWRA